MLDIAIKYSDQLKKSMLDLWFDDKYKYWNCDAYYDDFILDSSTWNRHQFVSLDNSANIVGYIGYRIDRPAHFAYGLNILNFTDNKIAFGIDLRNALKDIFEKFKFNKLRFTVLIGNPIEKSYDKMVKKYGGRIVGVYQEEIKLIDGELCDQKIYEITREDYLKSINK